MRRIFLFISIAIFLLGCSSELNEKNIVGKWRITEFSTNAELSPLLIASAKKIALSTTYEINSNHSFTLQDAYEPEGAQGEWKLNTDREQIELYFEHNTTGKPSTYEIKAFSTEKMIWIEDMGELGQTSMTLKKG